MRVPSRNEDTISQASHDLSQPQPQLSVAASEVIEEHQVQQPQPQQQQPQQPQHDQVDHKVTVSIHQPEEQVIIALIVGIIASKYYYCLFYCNYIAFEIVIVDHILIAAAAIIANYYHTTILNDLNRACYWRRKRRSRHCYKIRGRNNNNGCY